jgi:cytochrome c-type biogenesis protein
MLAVSSQNVTVFVAFGGGIISILTPCVLPMVPGYLSMITGFSIAELDEGGGARVARIALMTGLFTVGFGTVFTVLGLAVSAVGQAAFDNQTTLTRVSGAIVMVAALYLAGSQLLVAPRLYPEKRFTVTRRFGWATAPVLGAAFGFGWSPCIGPILAAIFGVSLTETSARAVALLAAYSIGMGVSFLAVGIAFGASAGALAFLRRHLRIITLVSAAVLFAFGVLLLMDRLVWLTSRLTELMDSLGLSGLVDLG